MLLKKENRPLSPHLSIYKPQITSVFSIFHRISGSLLALIIIFMPMFNIFFNSFLSLAVFCYVYLLFYSFIQFLCYFLSITFFFHCLNGFRHLLWDFGIGLDLSNLFVTALLVITLTLILSIIIIIC